MNVFLFCQQSKAKNRKRKDEIVQGYVTTIQGVILILFNKIFSMF